MHEFVFMVVYLLMRVNVVMVCQALGLHKFVRFFLITRVWTQASYSRLSF
jgi:hypothetical protein